MENKVRENVIPTMVEVFVDRNYDDAFDPISRPKPKALIDTAEEV